MANWKWFGKTHSALFKMSGGRLGKKVGGIDVVMIDTVGRKTGKIRTVPIACYPYKDSVLVVASNNGLDHDPAWWLNLKAKPDVEVQLAYDRYAVRARELAGGEREAVWPDITRINPRQKHYAKMTRRVLPVIYLERR